MVSFYYLIASLPLLRFEVQPTVTSSRLLKDVKGVLPEKECELVAAALEGRDGDNAYLKNYRQFEKKLNATLNAGRAEKLDVDDRQWTDEKSSEYRIRHLVEDVLGEPDALAAEMKILTFKWDHLTEMESSHFFDRESLISYALKLALLERKFLFNREDGNREFSNLFGDLQSEIATNKWSR